MTVVKLLESLIELHEARKAEGTIDEKAAELTIMTVEAYTQEMFVLLKTLKWLTKDAQARFDREQGVGPGEGSYSKELTEALAIIGKLSR